jgi:hypothetical protein
MTLNEQHRGVRSCFLNFFTNKQKFCASNLGFWI